MTPKNQKILEPLFFAFKISKNKHDNVKKAQQNNGFFSLNFYDEK